MKNAATTMHVDVDTATWTGPARTQITAAPQTRTVMILTSVLVEPATLTGPAHTQMTAAPQTLTVLTLTGCATCLHLTLQITVLSVTMASVLEAVQTWVVTVPTAPPPIPIAMVAMSVRSLRALRMRNAVRTLNVPSVMEPATLTTPAHTQMTAAPQTLTVIIMTGYAMCLHLTPQITVRIVTISIVLEAVLTWVMTVATVPAPILIAIAMCVRSLMMSVRQILTVMLTLMEYVSLMLLLLTKLTACIAILRV